MPKSERNANTNQICSECGSVVLSGLQSCPDCGHKFQPYTTQADTQKKAGGDTPPRVASSSKAPKKACPNCGNKVPIRVVSCNVCNYQFPFKNGTLPSASKKRSNTHKNHPVPESTDKPSRSLRNLSIFLIVYGVVLVAVLALLMRVVSSTWFAIIATATILISCIVCAVVGVICAQSYGKASLTPSRTYTAILILSTLILDFAFFKTTLPNYTGGHKWGMAAMAISITLAIVSSTIAQHIALKENYCSRCCLTHVMVFTKTDGKKEFIGYKFETHRAHQETARIYENGWDTGVSVKYTVPEYQENLGLHKTTTGENVYVCENCGRIERRIFSKTEKVDI